VASSSSGSGVAGGTWAILVAAGSGSRLGGDRPKAFASLAGRPLVAESLERLDASDWIDAIVVAAPPEWEEPTILLAEELVATKVASVVIGGATRAESVRNALAEVADDALVVVVHDAVIERLLTRLGEGLDGVIPGLPVLDTVKRVEGGVVAETIDRETLVTVQTPQAFVADRLRAAHSGDVRDATDCASLVERAGGQVGVVPGDPRLVKVTTPDDLALVSRLLETA
jgi:2-C-methyl-D-erythritol 4-phosphate cytidylyltransferase